MFSAEEKNNFFDMAESLKMHSRAELTDNRGNSIMEELYVDLLPADYILKKCLNNNTSFLIGRKGTGKTTIFLRMQEEIRKHNDKLCIYLDTITIYEKVKKTHVSLDSKFTFLNEYLLIREFIVKVLSNIISEIEQSFELSKFERLFKLIGIDKKQNTIDELKKLAKEICDNNTFEQIQLPKLETIEVKTKSIEQIEKKNIGINEAEATVSLTNLSTQGKIICEDQNNELLYSDVHKAYTADLLSRFNIESIIERIKNILKQLDINCVYVIFDDYSEIEDNAIDILTEVIIEPFARWSINFFKFKIAAYPNRYSLKGLDPQKVDKINLDFYELYSTYNRDRMEELATGYTKRLLTKRLQHYAKKEVNDFFEISSNEQDFYGLLFNITMNIPRVIGFILSYCYESHISKDLKINYEALRVASARYYKEVIADYINKQSRVALKKDERISIYQLEQLLKIIVDKQKNIKSRIIKGELSAQIYNKTNPYTSHFHILPSYEEFLESLELNFYITKYNEMSNKSGRNVSIYALNYGLCYSENLRWGKERGNIYRTYFIETPFNFTKDIDTFLLETKELKCINPNCNKKYEIKFKELLNENGNRCFGCNFPIKEFPVIEKFNDELERIERAKKYLPVEYDIMRTLYINRIQEWIQLKKIASLLDRDYRTLTYRCISLREDNLLLRKDYSDGVYYRISDKAIQEIFE